LSLSRNALQSSQTGILGEFPLTKESNNENSLGVHWHHDRRGSDRLLHEPSLAGRADLCGNIQFNLAGLGSNGCSMQARLRPALLGTLVGPPLR